MSNVKTKENYILNYEKDIKSWNSQDIYIQLKKANIFQKINIFNKLSTKQWLEYKAYLKSKKTKINLKKPDFNYENDFEIRNFNLWYSRGKKQALYNINFDIPKKQVTALIGPSGCGKSTFIKNLNRMNDEIEGVITEGDIYFDGKNMLSKNILEIRTRIGMVFQKPTPFDMSIYDNVAFGPISHGIKDKAILDKIVKQALIDAALWDEVENDLERKGTDLSGGQQQRLCIARVIAMHPEVILMDEPTSALDPIATSKIEELILKLKENYTIVIVTHSMTQTQRVSDKTAFFYKGKLVEHGDTRQIFTNPKEKLTKDYILGRLD